MLKLLIFFRFLNKKNLFRSFLNKMPQLEPHKVKSAVMPIKNQDPCLALIT